jgi:hypothetical protein
MENETKNFNKMKIIGISAVAILIIAAAFFTGAKFSGKDKFAKEISYETPAAIFDDAENFLGKRKTGISLESADSQAVENSGANAESMPAETDKKIIKNGDLDMKVDRVSEALKKISAIAKENGGDIFSSNISQTKNNIKSGYVSVKISVNNFEKTFEAIKEISSLVLRESVSGQNVTEKYRDIETRIKNKQAEEEAYKNIFNRAQKIEDILEVTAALNRVRGEIESYQGQLKYLASQTDMATINIFLSEDQNITIADSWRPFQVIKNAVNDLIKSIQKFISFLIVFFINFIPIAILYLILILVLFLIIKKIYRKIRKNKDV